MSTSSRGSEHNSAGDISCCRSFRQKPVEINANPPARRRSTASSSFTPCWILLRCASMASAAASCCSRVSARMGRPSAVRHLPEILSSAPYPEQVSARQAKNRNLFHRVIGGHVYRGWKSELLQEGHTCHEKIGCSVVEGDSDRAWRKCPGPQALNCFAQREDVVSVFANERNRARSVSGPMYSAGLHSCSSASEIP
jgi:hypothetical protein